MRLLTLQYTLLIHTGVNSQSSNIITAKKNFILQVTKKRMSSNTFFYYISWICIYAERLRFLFSLSEWINFNRSVSWERFHCEYLYLCVLDAFSLFQKMHIQQERFHLISPCTLTLSFFCSCVMKASYKSQIQYALSLLKVIEIRFHSKSCSEYWSHYVIYLFFFESTTFQLIHLTAIIRCLYLMENGYLVFFISFMGNIPQNVK